MGRRRRFNSQERVALFVVSGGHCAICGKLLTKGFHADHKQAFCLGGVTDMLNSQALCEKCNKWKAAKIMASSLSGWSRPLRDWQADAFNLYLQHTKPDFLAVATPGAGKTNFALRVAHFRLHAGQVERIIVVCPTGSLKKQWARAAAVVGIQLDPGFENSMCVPAADYHGMVVTYQQVVQAPDLFRLLCQSATLAIFDEVHHAGDNQSWGKAMRHAFEVAVCRLALSGTPFRGDNNTIPFVAYQQGRSRADYTYSYADSLRDGVCRYVFFPKFEGNMIWVSREKKGKVVDASFSDDLSQCQAAERLNTAISAKGDWLTEVLTDAHKRLCDLRLNGHPKAAGLVIARDQTHAEAITDLLNQITGASPTLAISDNPDASTEIDAFRDATSAWIVAVRMVSEGVDIPRLRVLVYATNISAELFFRQAVGRIVRMVEELDEQSAYFYIPADATLVKHAETIKEERDHQLHIDPPSQPKANSANTQTTGVTFMPLQAEARADGVVFDATFYSQHEIDAAAQACQAVGQRGLQPEVAAYLIRLGRHGATTAPTNSAPQSVDPVFEERAQIKQRINALAARYAMTQNIEVRDVHSQWLSKGGKRHNEATLEELKEKSQWLHGLFGANHE